MRRMIGKWRRRKDLMTMISRRNNHLRMKTERLVMRGIREVTKILDGLIKWKREEGRTT